MGGPDVVKAVVELFYRKIYADPRLLTFVHDQEQTHLRAKWVGAGGRGRSQGLGLVIGPGAMVRGKGKGQEWGW